MSEVLSLPASAPEAGERGADRLGGDCAACGERLAGAYCHACGERRARPQDESLGHFLREQFQEVTSADGKMWRTLRALFVPGKLTEEYFAGRRGLYLRPVRLFLVANVLFFVVLTFMGGQAFRGDAALYRSNPDFAALMEGATLASGLDGPAYDAAFGRHADTLSRTLIVVLVPLYAALLAIALAPARRPLVRHVVFATHFVAVFMAFTIVVALVLVVVAVAAGALGHSLGFGDAVLTPILVVGWTSYLVIAVRRVYDVPWWAAGLSGVLVATVGTLLVLRAYRWILFYVTLWTVDVPA